MNIILVYAGYSDLQFSDFISQIESSISYFSNPSSKQVSALECLFLQVGVPASQLTFFKMKYWLILPIFKIILTSLIIYFLSKMGKIRNVKTTYLTALLTLITLEQPGLLLNLGRFCTCFLQEINDYGYVQIDANISCSDP